MKKQEKNFTIILFLTLLGNIDHFIAFVTYDTNVLWNYMENPQKAPFNLDDPDEFWRFE